MFLHTLGSDSVRPITNANTGDDEIRPTIWRGTLAFVRDYGDQQAPYTKPVIAPRKRRSTRQPGVPTRRCEALFEGGSCRTTDRSISAMELWGANLALVVRYSVPDGVGISQTELRLDDIDERSARQVAYQVTGLGGQSLIGPSFTEGKLAWYKACLGDPGGCTQNAGAFRYALSGGEYWRDEERTVLSGFAWTGRGSRRIEAGFERCENPDGEVPCPVIVGDEPGWQRVEARRVR